MHADTRFLSVWESQCLIRHGAAARLTATELAGLLPGPEHGIFLGLEDGRHLFAVALGGREPPAQDGHFGGLRDLISGVPEGDAGLLATRAP